MIKLLKMVVVKTWYTYVKYLFKDSKLLCRKIATLENVRIFLWNYYYSPKQAFCSGISRFIFLKIHCLFPLSIPLLKNCSFPAIIIMVKLSPLEMYSRLPS